jgi:hypothetical protein
LLLQIFRYFITVTFGFIGNSNYRFTESRDTLEYLRRRIELWDYPVNRLHGGMNLEERIQAEENALKALIALPGGLWRRWRCE